MEDSIALWVMGNNRSDPAFVFTAGIFNLFWISVRE